MAVRRFHLNKQDGKLLGVCSGLADLTGVDATLIRIGLVAGTLIGGWPWTALAYVAVALLTKPAGTSGHDAWSIGRSRMSAHDLRTEMRDIDRRMADVETYVTSSESSLAREIEQLRRPAPADRA